MRNFKRFGRKWQGGWIQAAIPIASALIGAIGANQAAKTAAAGGQTTQVREPWGPASPYLQASMQQAQGWGASPLPYANPSEMVAPLNPLQLASVPAQVGAAGASQDVANAGAGGIMPFLTGQMMDVNQNPWLQAAIQASVRPQVENYAENILPNIRGSFGGTDAFDNSRQGIAEGIASRGLTQSIADTAARMSNAGYNTGMQATQNAFSQVPTVQSGLMMPGQQVWNVGAALQGQEQQLANARGLYDQPFNLYNAAGGAAGTQTTQAPVPTQNPLLAGVGGALTGMQMYDIWKRSQTGQNVYPVQEMVPGQYSTTNVQYG
jgi:hypothetical protein